MVYTTVTPSNYWYSIRNNVKEYLQSEIKRRVTIDANDPDITSLSFLQHLPWIVLPESDIPFDDTYLAGDANFDFTIEGTIYHDYEKLGDNAIRDIKGVMLALNTKKIRKQLARWNMADFAVSISGVNPASDVISGKRIVAVDFTIVVKCTIAIGQ
jgi:hypothetical protein